MGARGDAALDPHPPPFLLSQRPERRGMAEGANRILNKPTGASHSA
jgi:hypothetical protein